MDALSVLIRKEVELCFQVNTVELICRGSIEMLFLISNE